MSWALWIVPAAVGSFAACAEDGSSRAVTEDQNDAAAPEAAAAGDSGSSDVVTEAGVENCSASGLCVVDVPFPPKWSVTSIRGSSASDVWAVGNQGLIAHFNGSQWEVAETEVPDGSLVYTARGVWLERPDDVWIIEGDRIRHGTGWKGPKATSWSTFRYPDVSGYVSYLPATLHGLGDAVWVGHRRHYDRTPVERFSGWVDDKPKTPEAIRVYTQQILAITTARKDEVWFAGFCYRALGRSCAFRASQPAAAPDAGLADWEVTEFDARAELPLTAAWAHGDDVWLVGEAGAIRRITASSRPTKKFEFVGNPVSTDLYGVFGFGPDDVWVVGEAATVLHWDGTSWTKLSTPFDGETNKPKLLSVWGSSSKDVWIAGDGTMLRLRSKEGEK